VFRAFWDLNAQHTMRDRVLRFWALSGVAEKLKLDKRSLQTPTRPGARPAAALVGFTSLREFRPVLRYVPSDLRVAKRHLCLRVCGFLFVLVRCGLSVGGSCLIVLPAGV